MTKNLVRKIYDSDQNFVAPAGVKSVRITVFRRHLNQIGAAPGIVTAIDINGDAWGWGNGLVGDGDAQQRSSPVLVAGGKKWLQGGGLGLNRVNNGGLTIDGDIFTWGQNNVGELGNNAAGIGINQSSPVLVVGSRKYKQFIVGYDSGLALQTNGLVVTWGDNSLGQLGDNTTSNRSSPVLLAGNRLFRQVCGTRYAITPDGDAYGWGDNSAGGLGINSVTATSSPVLILGGRKWKFIAGSENFAGIDVNDDLYMCGNNAQGALGMGDIINRSSPTLVPGGLKWKTVGTGPSNTWGVTTDGVAYAWGGSNSNGQMGIGDTSSRSTPTLVVGGYKFFQIADIVSGNSAFLGLDGNAYTCGSAGGAGDGSATVNHSSPVLVVGNKIWRTTEGTVLNRMTVPVIPGNTYPVVVFNSSLSFGGIGLGNHYGLTQIQLEYFA